MQVPMDEEATNNPEHYRIQEGWVHRKRQNPTNKQTHMKTIMGNGYQLLAACHTQQQQSTSTALAFSIQT